MTTVYSRRERHLFRLISQGASPKAIAAEFEISFNTAHTHIRNLCRKAGVSGDRELIIYAMQQPGCMQTGAECRVGLHPPGVVDGCPHCIAIPKAA
jgi:DNA-binding CsgD family transcriptional regulator